MPINISAGEDSVNRLEKRMMKLTKEVDKILLNSQRARAISEKYKKIATQHLNVVAEFTEQKANCRNLEDIYKEQQTRKRLDKRVIKKQGRNIVSCYHTLEALNYNFDDMNKYFSGLKQSIRTLNDMSENDVVHIRSLEKQVKFIEDFIDILTQK